MPRRAILLTVTLVVLCSSASWAQASAQNQVKPCQTQQQIATATPPPAPMPVEPAKNGAAVSPVATNQRLHPGEKFKVYLRYTYSPYTFAGVAFNAGMSQATGGWYSYGGGIQGYGKRFAAALADTESGAFFGAFLFPVLLHEDPRYFRSNSHGTWSRTGYAVSRVLVTRNEDGGKTPNFSLISGALAASALANSYYPREDRGLGDTMARAGNGLLSVAEMNLLREFWPDISRKFKKHEPKTLKKLEEKPRVAKIEQMVMGPIAQSPCSAPNPGTGNSDNH